MSSPLTYADLTRPMTKDEILEEVAIPIFESYDFPVDAFEGEPLADIEVQCEALARESAVVAQTAKSATLDASGDWLTLKAEQDYGTSRKPATATIGAVTFTDSTGSRQIFAQGQLLIVCKNAPDAVFTVPAFDVPANGTSAPVTITAEKPGADYNVDASDLMLAVSVPGLALQVAPAKTWITTQGTDVESDESLRLRCQVSRSALSPDEGVENFTGVDGQYERWALNASVEVNRVQVIANPNANPIASPPEPTIRVCVAGPAGPLASPVLTAVAKYVLRRRPMGIYVVVENVETWTCFVRGTYQVEAAKEAAAAAKIGSQLDRFFSGESIKLRDSDEQALPGLAIGAPVLVSQIVEIVMAVDGVEDVVLTDGAGAPLPTGATIGGLPLAGTVAVLDRSQLQPA